MVSQEIRRTATNRAVCYSQFPREGADGTLQGHRGRKNQGVRRQKEQGRESRGVFVHGKSQARKDKQAEDWLSEQFCRLWGTWPRGD